MKILKYQFYEWYFLELAITHLDNCVSCASLLCPFWLLVLWRFDILMVFPIYIFLAKDRCRFCNIFSWGLAGQAAQPRFLLYSNVFLPFFIVLNVPIFFDSFVYYKFQQKIEFMNSNFRGTCKTSSTTTTNIWVLLLKYFFTSWYIILLHMLHI